MLIMIDMLLGLKMLPVTMNNKLERPMCYANVSQLYLTPRIITAHSLAFWQSLSQHLFPESPIQNGGIS